MAEAKLGDKFLALSALAYTIISAPRLYQDGCTKHTGTWSTQNKDDSNLAAIVHRSRSGRRNAGFCFRLFTVHFLRRFVLLEVKRLGNLVHDSGHGSARTFVFAGLVTRWDKGVVVRAGELGGDVVVGAALDDVVEGTKGGEDESGEQERIRALASWWRHVTDQHTVTLAQLLLPSTRTDHLALGSLWTSGTNMERIFMSSEHTIMRTEPTLLPSVATTLSTCFAL